MSFIELLSDPQVWVAFATLTALELVLGIDNIVFISILVDKLPAHQRTRARRIGLFLAMFMRIALLTLSVLEIVLGIDNIVFISILAGKLRPEERGRARQVGLGLAMFIRILLLL